PLTENYQNNASLSVWGWGGLGVVLFLITFGPFAVFYLAFYIFCFVGGGFAVTLLFGKTNSERHLERCEHSYLPATQTGILKTLDEMRLEPKPIQIDRRLTGSNYIDEPLQQVIQFALRDYIQYWYYTLSEDDSFLLEIRQTVQNALVQFSTRSKEVDWQPYLTTRLVDDFATHLRVFRKAQDRLEDSKQSKEMVESFFEAEVEMERNICRDVVCTSLKDEEGFLRDLCEVLLYLLLPPGDFHNKNMRYFLREILARGVLLPLVNQLSDPDYINQFVIWMIRDSSCNYEAFMNILKLTDRVSELEAVKDKALEELQYLRSLDTAGDDINVIKNQINSLMFVKKVCETRIQRLQSGKEVDALKLAANLGKLCIIPLEHILVHNIALQFFMDYMLVAGAQAELFFWLTVEGYRVTAQQQLEVMEGWQKDGRKGGDTKGLLKAAALGVYEQYLSDKASPRVQVDEASVLQLGEKLQKDSDPTPEIFNDIQTTVYDMMLRDERFYPSFRQSPLYIRMLAELDMLKEPSYRGSDDGDGVSLVLIGCFSLLCLQSLDDLSNSCHDDNIQLHAFISDTGVCNDHGKTYALYAITVLRRNHDGSEDSWKTYRRYSDFHDFHMRITEQFENLTAILKLPGKKTFNNMDRDFLERRKKDLNSYLQLLLNPEMMKACPTLVHYVYDFLENKQYSKGKGDFARKMDTFVNPLRSSMRNVSNAVKGLPDSLAGGMNKAADNMGRMSEKLGQDIKQAVFKVPPMLPKSDFDPEHCRVSAQLDDNVSTTPPPHTHRDPPVFDLKERNQWLHLTVFPVTHTHTHTPSDRRVDSYWPNGILAESPPRRDKNIRMRTRVAAKTNLLGIMPDELKHIIGADTTRKGILRVFDMFQHGPMNRRLVYVLLEGFLETMFPHYKFPELFVKLHSRSPRTARYTQKVKSTFPKR
uniref:Sorting nexin 13 n=1 Tax=Oncorhynchus tshawytscha TaxID=74940 RepID=A0A8C8CAJ2_ONCTS